MQRHLRGLLILAAVGLSLVLGCSDNPYKAQTWMKKLKNPKEFESAVTNIEHLCDPVAIPLLGEYWRKQAHPGRLLAVIISLARPLSKEEALAKYCREHEVNGRQASWNRAMPFLKEAIDSVDEANARSIDSAEQAASALGESGLDEGLDVLVSFTDRPSNKALVVAQTAAIRAIGKFGKTNRARAVSALTKIISRDAPTHPRTINNPDEKKATEEKFTLYLVATRAAIDALGDLRAPEAGAPLMLAMYRTPELFVQVRRALVASGSAVQDELRRVLRGDHAEVNSLFTTLRLDKYCGEANELPPDKCVAVSAKDYYAAVVLGDFYDPASADALLQVLDRPAAPAYVMRGAPGPSQYNAALDALRKIGAPKGAEKVQALWATAGNPIDIRVMALGAYGYIARGDGAVSALAAIADDNGAPDMLRQEAASTVARIAKSSDALGALERLAEKYAKASAESQAKADVLKPAYDKVKGEFDAAKKAFEEAKKAAQKLAADGKAAAAEISAATVKAGELEDAYQAAKTNEQAQAIKYRPEERAAKDYRYYQRMFQTHMARIEIGTRCKDAGCFAQALKATPDEAAQFAGRYIRDIGKWTDDEKKLLVPAQIERAMLELGKLGAAASEHTELLLDNAKSTDRLTRQAVLLALPKIAKLPCASCETKLQAAIKAGEGKSTLAQLNVETQMLRNYFSWAGGKVAEQP